MTTCSEAAEQLHQIRAANPNYSQNRRVADYVVTVAHWQGTINCAGHYTGPADGVWGPNSRRGVQNHLTQRGYYGGLRDGIWGPLTWTAIQSWATKEGSYRGPVDGVPGPNTWEAIFWMTVPVN